jgi:hypothetical protein
MEFWMVLDRTKFENRGLGIRHASQRKTVTRASYISKEQNHIFDVKMSRNENVLRFESIDCVSRKRSKITIVVTL